MPDRSFICGTARAAGGSRNFKLWIPRTLENGSPCPLLIFLHGCGHDAEVTARISGMNEVAETRRFLVVYPEQSRWANPMKCWNWFHPKHQKRDFGEPSILAAIVYQVCSTHNVDPERIYVAGFSSGGMMSTILGATYPDLFAGLAVFAGLEFKAAEGFLKAFAAKKKGGPSPIVQGQLAFDAMRSGLAHRNRRRMPVIVFHGTADTCVSLINAEQSIAQWRKTNACLAAANSDSGFALTERVIEGEVPNGFTYRKRIYVGEDTNLLMEQWLVEGLGHAWSGSPAPSKCGDPRGPNASEEIWRFFEEAGRPLAGFGA